VTFIVSHPDKLRLPEVQISPFGDALRKLQVPVLLAVAMVGSAKDFNTYIGDQFAYSVAAIATDTVGNTYLTGSRAVTTTSTDVFVTKLDTSGNLIFTVTFGGKGSGAGSAIAADPAGNLLIAGSASSPDFPLRNPLQAPPGRLPGTGFVMKLAPDGSILWSTFFGGVKGASAMSGIATDARGDVYVTGWTNASDYPHTPGLPADAVALSPPISGAFFAKISSAGDQILWAGGLAANQHACSGGLLCSVSSIDTHGVGVAVDASGNAYIGGDTNGNGIQGTHGVLLTSGIGAFILKVNANGGGVGYLTFFDSRADATTPITFPATTLSAISVDATGEVFAAGTTDEPGAIGGATSLPPPTSTPPRLSGYMAQFSASGTQVAAVFSLSSLGPGAGCTGSALTTDFAGRNVWVSGTCAIFDGTQDVLVHITQSASGGLGSTQYSPQNSVARAIALDSNGVLHAAGATGIVSTISVTSPPPPPRIFGFGNAAGGVLAGRIAPGELISIYGQQFGLTTPLAASFDSSGFLPTVLAGAQVTINGIPAPLLYASNRQINAVVPFGVPTGTARNIASHGGRCGFGAISRICRCSWTTDIQEWRLL
jgi:hypothetical protein